MSLSTRWLVRGGGRLEKVRESEPMLPGEYPPSLLSTQSLSLVIESLGPPPVSRNWTELESLDPPGPISVVDGPHP